MIRLTRAHVDLDALAANVQAVRQLLETRQPPPGLIGVVKANAYGHGAVQVARMLERSGVSMLACADIEEGVQLRAAGIELPILVFGALSLSDLEGLFTHRLVPTISTPTAARALERAAAARAVRLSCHLKIDTGMNRLGFRFDNLRHTMPEVAASAHLEIEAVYTHFGTADVPGDPLFDLQRARFDRAVAELATMGIAPRSRHAANSAALLRERQTWFDFVRPGILLYGVPPGGVPADPDLRPVMSIRSRLVAVKGMRPGERLGYGGRLAAGKPLRIGVVPAGYADGLDTRLEGRGAVLIRGRRAPIIGSVCMDMLTVDVTDLEAQTGDEVVILGRQGDARIDVTETARTIGTIPYEVLCRIGARIGRVYNSA